MTNSKKNYLYIAFGNTNTSFAVFDSDKIEENNIVKIKTKEFLEKDNFGPTFWQIVKDFNLSNIDKVFISSVVLRLNEKVNKFFKENKIETIFLSTENQISLDLSKLYNQWELGADIIAQSTYVTHFFQEAIIVSLGTATIIYHIKDNVFNGCIIMPGINKSQEILEKNTSIKSCNLDVQEKNLGFNTQEAISIGILNSIEVIVNNLTKELNTKCPIIYSGGNSFYFRERKWWHIKNLELLGLYIFSKKFD